MYIMCIMWVLGWQICMFYESAVLNDGLRIKCRIIYTKITFIRPTIWHHLFIVWLKKKILSKFLKTLRWILTTGNFLFYVNIVFKGSLYVKNIFACLFSVHNIISQSCYASSNLLKFDISPQISSNLLKKCRFSRKSPQISSSSKNWKFHFGNFIVKIPTT